MSMKEKSTKGTKSISCCLDKKESFEVNKSATLEAAQDTKNQSPSGKPEIQKLSSRCQVSKIKCLT